MWQDATDKEIHNISVVFEVLGEGEKVPPSWSEVTGHLVFNVEMFFTRKSCWVLDVHKTADPISSTYAGVVSREIVRIAFTYAALNGVDLFVVNIRNSYLQVLLLQKDYIIFGP